jgi:hypothetical protein
VFTDTAGRNGIFRVKKKRYFIIGGPLLFIYKRQSKANHYYESFLAVSDDPGYEMSRRAGKLPRSGFVHILLVFTF